MVVYGDGSGRKKRRKKKKPSGGDGSAGLEVSVHASDAASAVHLGRVMCGRQVSDPVLMSLLQERIVVIDPVTGKKKVKRKVKRSSVSGSRSRRVKGREGMGTG